MSNDIIKELKDLWDNELDNIITITDNRFIQDLNMFKNALRDLFNPEQQYSTGINDNIEYIRKFYHTIKEYIGFNTDSPSRLEELNNKWEEFVGLLQDLAISNSVISSDEKF